MPFATHYAQHIERLQALYTDALLATGHFDAVLIHSGSARYHYADDQTPPFRAYGHFSHWLPVNRPEQVVLILPGQTPVYFQVVPRDFWYEQTAHLDDWVRSQWHVHTLERSQGVADALQGLSGVDIPPLARIAFLGENTPLRHRHRPAAREPQPLRPAALARLPARGEIRVRSGLHPRRQPPGPAGSHRRASRLRGRRQRVRDSHGLLAGLPHP